MRQVAKFHPLPPLRQRKRLFILPNRGQRFVAFDLARRNQPVFFGADAFQQFTGGFVGGVLGDELAAHGQLQDGLFQRINGAGAVEQGVEVGGHALPGVLGGRGAVGVGEGAEQRLHQLAVVRGLLLALGLQRIAHAHEFFDAGDDAGLFG